MSPEVVEACRRIAAVVVLVVNLLIPPVPAAFSLLSSSTGGAGGHAGPATGGAALPPSSASASDPTTSDSALPTTATGTGTATTDGAATTTAESVLPAGTASAVANGTLPVNSSTAAGSTAGSTGSTTGSTGSTGSTSVNGANGTQTAAQAHGWGQATRVEEFNGNLSAWGLYDGPGHAGNGKRTPSAATVAGGVLTINGDANGNSEGMAWNPGAKYGRWEARMRAPVADPDYHAVLLLWPDSEKWPDDGEVDFMENSDPTRQRTEFFLHYGNGTSNGGQLSGAVNGDATQWHNWAVEWAPDHITAFLDGQPWWTTTNTSVLPPGPMHMTIQLDLFRGGGGLKPSSMQVDWVHYYPITGSGTSSAPSNATNPPAITGGTPTTTTRPTTVPPTTTTTTALPPPTTTTTTAPPTTAPPTTTTAGTTTNTGTTDPTTTGTTTTPVGQTALSAQVGATSTTTTVGGVITTTPTLTP